jgi:hypothetical protein
MGNSRYNIKRRYNNDYYGSILMTKARDLATLAGSATTLATDAEVTAAVAAADATPTALLVMGA